MTGLTGQEAGEIGMDRALSGENPEWLAKAFGETKRLARTFRPFTAEDIRMKVGSPTHSGAMGAILSKAARAGVIRVHGYGTSNRKTSHGRVLRQWIGRAVPR